MGGSQGLLFFTVLLLCVLSYFLFSRFVVTAVVVKGRSMAPTLQDGDHCILNRLPLWLREPRRGDLVVIEDAGHSDYAVKRIVALPGETIAIRENQVWIDGEALAEPYLGTGIKTQTLTHEAICRQMGQEEYYVMGDNRPTSEDSRSYGPMNRTQIVGLLIR